MATPRAKPSALRHGLFSRHARLEWSLQVDRVADALLGTSPRGTQVLEAAHDRAWLVGFAPGGDYFIHQKVAEHATELRRLADYERRANSLRRKALRRLDYERIEAEHRRVAGMRATGASPAGET